MSAGYVVRGTWKPREPDPGKPRDVYAWWWELIQDVQWISDREKVPADGRLLFPTIGEADAARCKSSHLSGVAIFRVHPDGREERLPSYEEALVALSILRDEAQFARDYKRGGGMSVGGPPLLWTCPPSALKELLRLADGAPVVDVLAALEAAERRLLEAGGYQPDPNESAWWRSRSGVLTARDEAVSIVRHEFQIERRRLAAKGGA